MWMWINRRQPTTHVCLQHCCIADNTRAIRQTSHHSSHLISSELSALWLVAVVGNWIVRYCARSSEATQLAVDAASCSAVSSDAMRSDEMRWVIWTVPIAHYTMLTSVSRPTVCRNNDSGTDRWYAGLADYTLKISIYARIFCGEFSIF